MGIRVLKEGGFKIEHHRIKTLCIRKSLLCNKTPYTLVALNKSCRLVSKLIGGAVSLVSFVYLQLYEFSGGWFI